MITPNMLIIKYKNNKDFIEFVWLFAVLVSQTKVEARELLNTCGNNLFKGDLCDDIAWGLCPEKILTCGLQAICCV